MAHNFDSKKICILRHAYYPADPRVRKEAEALAAKAHLVDVICLQKPGQRLVERVRGVNAYRIPIQHRRKSKLRYILEYVSSFILFALTLTLLHLRKGYDVIQVNSMPDFLVFATLVPRLLGVKIVLDLQECMPEIFMVKYRLDNSSWFVRLLKRLEQLSISYADHVITCNEQMKRIFVSRGAPANKISITLNSADDRIFKPIPQHGEPVSSKDSLVLISHGSIEERWGLDTAIKAVAVLREHVPGVRLEIFGDGESREDLIKLTHSLDLDGPVMFRGHVPFRQLVQALAEADIGLVTIRQYPEMEWVHTFKMSEFIAMEKPVVITRSPAVEAYFDESCLMFFESDNEHDLAQAVLELHNNPKKRQELVQNASRVYERYKWSVQAPRYCNLIESMACQA